MVKLTRKLAKPIDESDFSLTNITYRVIQARQNERSAEDIAYYDQGFHLSSSLNFAEADERYCAREIELGRKYADIIDPWKPEPELQIKFDIGTEAHRLSQNYWRDLGLLKEVKAGLYGAWKCESCDKCWYDFSPKRCPACKAPINRLKYIEYEFYSKKWDIKSKTDGLLWIYNESLDEWFEYLIEVKTIKQSGYGYSIGFDQLNAPLTMHYNQAQGYAWLRYFEHQRGLDTIRELPEGFEAWPTFKKTIIFFYVNKNGAGKPFKEFSVPLDKAVWRLITSRIGQVQEDEAEGRLAPRIEKCSSLAAAKRICGVAELCFKEEE